MVVMMSVLFDGYVELGEGLLGLGLGTAEVGEYGVVAVRVVKEGVEDGEAEFAGAGDEDGGHFGRLFWFNECLSNLGMRLEDILYTYSVTVSTTFEASSCHWSPVANLELGAEDLAQQSGLRL